jgi:DNA-binding transcriptional LysR family regulator
MYNPQLETFIRLADAGSFNKAAGTGIHYTYCGPKAVNLLEADLGVQLFERTHRGLFLTRQEVLCIKRH